MAIQKFDAVLREALWIAHSKQCAYTHELVDLTVSGVLPGSCFVIANPSFESSSGGGVGGFAIGFGVETVPGREPVVVFDTPSGRQPIKRGPRRARLRGGVPKITVIDANVTGVKVVATR